MSTIVEIDDELESRVHALADLRGRSPDAVLREAVAQYVSREEARESFKREGRESWEDFERTGLHLTGEEVRAWLSAWRTDVDTPMPDCHGSS